MPQELLLEQAMVDPATLIPHPGNPRVHQDQVLRDSVKEFGQYRAVVVNRRTGRLVAGHGTVAAFAVERPGEPIQVSYVDVDEQTADRILLIDNRSGDLAGTDERLLAELLASLPDLDHTGYEPGDLTALEALLNPPGPWGGDGDQDILEETDRSSWPEIRARVAPEVYARWLTVPGVDDPERVVAVLDAAGR